MTRFPHFPALHVCEDMRGGERVFALMSGIMYPDGHMVPIGFKTDGISFPKIVRIAFSKLGVGFSAAIRHDYDYAMQTGSRKEADQRVLKYWRLEGMGRCKSWWFYKTLQAGGWIAWKKNKKRPKSYFYEHPDNLLHLPTEHAHL